MINVIRLCVFAAMLFYSSAVFAEDAKPEEAKPEQSKSQAVATEEHKLPDSYAACKKGAPYTTITEQKCIYIVPEDKNNGDATKDYLACRMTSPHYEFLKKFTCKYEPSEDLTRMTALRCKREHMPDVLPPFEYECKFTFYNPDYVFPLNYHDCMAKEDHKEDVTPELKKICTLTTTYNPAVAGEFFFDDDEANKIIEKCQIAGGQARVIEGAFPECVQIFTEP